MKEKIKSLFYIFLPIILGSILGFIIKDSYKYYEALNRPPLNPPKILFPIMWSIIYLLMGISYYLFKKEYKNTNKEVRNSYYIQLTINLLWSIIFFVFKFKFFSIVWILLLLIAVFNLYSVLKPLKRISSYLLIPYILWIGFATYLTIGIYILNR